MHQIGLIFAIGLSTLCLEALADTNNSSTTFSDDWLQRAAAVVPSPRQLAWQKLEFGGMIHFGMNTFTGREWGDGKEDPKWFNPTELDAREWVRTFKAAGMRLVVLTAKHHDGFCLWPSQLTEHCVRNSPWREGKGDLVKEVADACREEGLKFGVYLSPADLHESKFGTPAYVEHFSNQLKELLTNYGEIAEVWFDDANPSNKPLHYDFLAWKEIVRALQPNAVIFGRGPDVRWIGNEGGVPRTSEWSVVPIPVAPDLFTGGNFMNSDLGSRDRIKHAQHLHWWPAEAAVSIRPRWFYHPEDNSKVLSSDQLFDMYLKLVGGNSFFMLGVPPRQSGRLHTLDADKIKSLGERIKATFNLNHAEFAEMKIESKGSELNRHLQDNQTHQFRIALTLSKPTEIKILDIGEHIQSGKRIEAFTIFLEKNGHWHLAATGGAIGYRRIIKLSKPFETQNVQLVIDTSRSKPTLSHFRLY